MPRLESNKMFRVRSLRIHFYRFTARFAVKIIIYVFDSLSILKLHVNVHFCYRLDGLYGGKKNPKKQQQRHKINHRLVRIIHNTIADGKKREYIIS